MPMQVYRPQESVYDLLPKEDIKYAKPPRYMSKFKSTVLQEEKLPKWPMRTMGPAKVEVPSPEKFLKKHSKEPKLPDKVRSAKEGRINPLNKPPVPTRREMSPIRIQTKQDLIKSYTFVTKKPKPISVDSHKGHREVLENSGLVPKYIKKTDFGKVPLYIQQRNAEKLKAQEESNKYVKEQIEKQAMKQLSEEERQEFLEGLKKIWDRLHHEYQGLSVVIDNLSKLAHKERLEADMKRLEKDIKIFEKCKIIRIAEN